jgi:glycosyltransferase involved in cell wall biosynthesis
MTRPTVLVISPFYLPVEEGLAHYTTEFARHLARIANVVVLTSTESQTVRGPGAVEVRGSVARWTWFGPLRELVRALRVRPDVVLVEFVPFMYARKGGINATIVLLCAGLSLRARWTGGGHLQVMFHELWYPFTWRPKSVVMHVAHRCMVFGIAAAARDVFCATSRFAEEVRRNLGPFTKTVHVLAVGSNLERDERVDLSDERGATDALQIGLFGGLHPSKNVPLVLRTLHEAARRGSSRFSLTIVGTSRDELVRAVPELERWLDEDVAIKGQLPAEAAAAELSKQDFLIAYFQDGVSSRRGSLLAALCEGVPVVTTYRDFSDEVFLDRSFVKLLPCEEAAFAEGLLAFLGSGERPFGRVDRREVRRFYEEHFSWSAVIRRYTSLSGFAERAVAAEPG